MKNRWKGGKIEINNRKNTERAKKNNRRET